MSSIYGVICVSVDAGAWGVQNICGCVEYRNGFIDVCGPYYLYSISKQEINSCLKKAKLRLCAEAFLNRG